MNRPAVLLLDEPLGALDLKLRKQLQVELKRIQRDVGITFIYVTHDQEEALTMSDRIAVMNRGVVEQVADPETVYERPATTFVAGFIGVSNLMPGEVISANGGGAQLRLDAGPTVRAPDTGGATAGERAHAVVRPEKLVLSSAGERGRRRRRPSVEGQVESSLYLGTATQMVVRLGDDTRMTVLVPNADAEARRDLPAAGDAARLSWSDENIHIVREGRADTPTNDDLERQFERLLRDPLTRRRMLQRGAGGSAERLGLAYLAACGTDEPARRRGQGRGGEADREGRDRRARCTSPTGRSTSTRSATTLKKFEKKYGTKVKYVEEINDNNEFFGKVRQQYDQGQSGGRDIHVVTDWMAARMMRLGYVQKFDKSTMPNVDEQPDRAAQVAAVRPAARLLGAVAVGPDRDHLPQGQGQARAQVDRRPLRSGLQGQGHDAHRDARHASAS